MPNVNRVNGFRLTKLGSGAPINGALHTYYAEATNAVAIFTGDLVSLTGGSDAAGVRAVAQAVAGAPVVGVVAGVLPNFANLNLAPMRPASTAGYLLVLDDPHEYFVAQEDGVGGQLSANSAGLNVNFIVGTGNTVTGQSGMQIDSSTAAATATLPLKLIEPLQQPENTVGQAYAKWVVKLNNHQLASGTGTAGI